jgi:hypothetical protein
MVNSTPLKAKLTSGARTIIARRSGICQTIFSPSATSCHRALRSGACCGRNRPRIRLTVPNEAVGDGVGQERDGPAQAE